MLEFKYADMMNDPGLSALDRQWVVNFQTAVDDFLAKRGGYSPEFSMFNIASSIGLDVSGLHKEGTLLYALWITILNSLQKYITANDFKYASIEDFLAAYQGLYQNESDYEKRYLWLTANWMNILFRMITARKNKGLVLYVVPKLIEGWDAKYVTGSGQTKATANRVHIFETEGNVKANQRGKAKAGKKKPPHSSDGASPRAPSVPKPKKRKLDPVVYENVASNFAFTQPYGSVAHYREQRQAAAPGPMPLRSRRSEGLQLDEPLNEDVKSTFAAWQEATENYGLGLLNLSRSNSYMANGLAKNVDQQLTDPLDYQRGFSWTEIPVAPAPLSTANNLSSSGAAASSNGVMNMYPMAGGNLNMSEMYNNSSFNGMPNGYVNGNPDVLPNMNVAINGGLPVLPASEMPSIFPPPEDPSTGGVTTVDAGTGSGSDSTKLNLEVGSIVPVSGLMDIFQGYK